MSSVAARGRRAAAVALAAIAAAGFAAAGRPPRAEVIWEGEVLVEGVREIPAGTILLIRPGARVVFSFQDPDGDGVGESALAVRGRIRAAGTPERPIVFVAEGDAAPGRWAGIRIDDSPGAVFTDCRFAGAETALHVHGTPLEVERCRFEGNAFGVRFRGGPVRIRRSSFVSNGTAVRYWESGPLIEGNDFEGNETAIFCREGSAGTRVWRNNFASSLDYHLKLGELQDRDVDARWNWWGSADPGRIATSVYDREDAGYIGRVVREPFAARPLRRGDGGGGD